MKIIYLTSFFILLIIIVILALFFIDMSPPSKIILENYNLDIQ